MGWGQTSQCGGKHVAWPPFSPIRNHPCTKAVTAMHTGCLYGTPADHLYRNHATCRLSLLVCTPLTSKLFSLHVIDVNSLLNINLRQS